MIGTNLSLPLHPLNTEIKVAAQSMSTSEIPSMQEEHRVLLHLPFRKSPKEGRIWQKKFFQGLKAEHFHSIVSVCWITASNQHLLLSEHCQACSVSGA